MESETQHSDLIYSQSSKDYSELKIEYLKKIKKIEYFIKSFQISLFILDFLNTTSSCVNLFMTTYIINTTTEYNIVVTIIAFISEILSNTVAYCNFQTKISNLKTRKKELVDVYSKMYSEGKDNISIEYSKILFY